MEMADSCFCENDLDEEKARRSILVTNVPGNLTCVDVIIHFQKPSNGGGEVECGKYHHPESRSSVVITFEDPSTVETTIARRQVLGKTEVTVQRYPVGIRIPEVFSDVDARLNPEILDLLPSMERVLRDLNREHGIRCCNTAHGKSKGHGRSRQLHGHVAASGATVDDVRVTPRCPGKSDEDDENDEDKEIDFKIFQSVPIILNFILSVPKYSTRIEVIESEFNVIIRGVEGGSKVVIKPLPGCTHKKHDDACEEYIKLYREVYDGPMMSKDVVLKPGKDSSYLSALEAVQEVLQKAPVAIQKIEEPDKWLFYGEETIVKSAIKAVCKKLGIEHPFRKTRKVVARHDPEKEEERSGSGNNHHLTLEDNEAERDAPKESYDDMKRFAYEDHQGNKEKPFEIETKKGFRLTIHQGDITQESVDVIVNSTDESLGFLAGLPAELVRRGGRVIQDEAQTEGKRRKAKPGNIIITGPGKLYCLKVFHVITTRLSRKSKEDCKNFAKEACLKCLKQTNKEKLNSIAFPALGTGQQGMALGLCAAGMINAVEEYMKATDPKKGAVTDIRFVDQDLSAVEVFKVELTKRYGYSIVRPTKEDLSTRGKYVNPNLSTLDGFTYATERQAHPETRQRNDELEISLATERQAHQATRQRNDELEISLATERQANQDARQRNDELEMSLATERQAHQATRQRNDELEMSLATERHAHQATRQRNDELEMSLATERHAHQATRQRNDELEMSLATERHAHQATRQRNDELEVTRNTLQQALDEYRESRKSFDWILLREEIQVTDKVIGRGAWGKVMEGTFRGSTVAVKEIHELILSPHIRKLFEREIGIASRCRHPCLLQFIGATYDDQPLFVSELLDASLRAVLNERPLERTEITIIAMDVVKGLNYLHLNKPTPIVHRDLSSANVLLWKHNNCWRAKVSDFGTAKFLHQSMSASPGCVLYSEPESQTSRQTPKMDVYSFGVLLCEMSVNELPDVARRNVQVAMVKDQTSRRLIKNCLETEPGERPSMNQILELLRSWRM